jgi:hypothetical protein
MTAVIWSEATNGGVTTFSAHDLTGELVEERIVDHNEGYIHALAANGATIVYATYLGVYVSNGLNAPQPALSFPTEHGGYIDFGSGSSETGPVSIIYSNGKFRARFEYVERYNNGLGYVGYDLYYTSVDGYDWVGEGTFTYDGVQYVPSLQSVYYEPTSDQYYLITTTSSTTTVKVTSDFITYVDKTLPFGQYTNSLVIYDGFIYWLEYYYGAPFYRVKQVVKYNPALEVVATYPISLPSDVTLTHNYWYWGSFLDQFGAFYSELQQDDDWFRHAIYKVVGANFERVQALSGCISTNGIQFNNRNDYILVAGQRVCISGISGAVDCGANLAVITILGPGATTLELTLHPDTNRHTITDGYEYREAGFWTEEVKCVEQALQFD